LGGPPIIPPSITRISGVSALNSAAIDLAVDGAMALRSRKYSGSELNRFGDLYAVIIRWAVALASRGGTIERI
jgi:hypothetical protein